MNLSGRRLERCYDLAPGRIRQYSQAEIRHVSENIRPADHILELGCGYGRVMKVLSGKAASVTGIDISEENIRYASHYLIDCSDCRVQRMDAIELRFPEDYFDLVFCIQNGISAFKVNQMDLIREALRVTKPGGIVLFSSYSTEIWKERLHWFEIQAAQGLVGKIDYGKTGSGTIVCQDGFSATTISEKDFVKLTKKLNWRQRVIRIIDRSSLFLELRAG